MEPRTAIAAMNLGVGGASTGAARTASDGSIFMGGGTFPLSLRRAAILKKTSERRYESNINTGPRMQPSAADGTQASPRR